KDFALWQRSYLSGERLEKQLSYWKDKLNGYETLNLITDYSRPSKIDYRGSDIGFELDEATSNSLKDLAKALNVSLYSLLLAGYYLMLRAYSNQSDLVIGSPVANRHYSQIENLIGFFVNTLALRVEVDSNLLVKDFIQHIGKEVVSAQFYQDLPFEKLVEELGIAKDTSRHPIFQVMFSVQGFGSKQFSNQRSELLQTYTLSSNASLYSAAKFDITTIIDDSQTTLRGSFNYAVSLYKEETIFSFIETYTEILRQFVELKENKDKLEQTRILDLHYLKAEQYQQIIYDWNATDKEYPSDKTIHQLFEEQVVKTPDNIAIVYEDTKLTYRELNERSNQLANYLRKEYDVQPDDLIALCLDRSEYMLIAILAVLKAGGAYVPMDPGYPEERLKYILEDTQAKVILANEIYQKQLIELSKSSESLVIALKVSVVAIDSDAIKAALNEQVLSDPISLSNLLIHVTSKNLAYIIYTSGTTGNPKGVMVEHKGV
ncbi:MAG: hypothetical protein B7Y76_10960, partial [Sphingobacteriia bacterium 35-40-5]